MWCEAHSVDIVGATDQFFRRSLQDLQGGPETVIWTGGGRVGGDGGRAKVQISLKKAKMLTQQNPATSPNDEIV